MKIKKVKLTTTLALLRQHQACESGYRKIRKHLGAKYPDNKPINLLVILKNNGVQNMLWCIRATIEDYQEYRASLFGMYADFAASVLPIYEKYAPDDDRPRKAIKAARSGKNCADAADAAYAAADAAAYAAYAADAADAAYAAADAAAYAAYAAIASTKESKKQVAIIKRYLK